MSLHLDPPNVAYLGPAASYTHQAALGCLEKGLYNLIPARTITDVFEAVQSEQVVLGVVPIENSTNGAVIFTFELLADRYSHYPDVNISRETYIHVNHCLLGQQITATASPGVSPESLVVSRTDPMSNWGHIKRLYSHPQAWGQCDIFLSTHLTRAERIDVSSTSRAAELAKMDASGNSAAIASKLAADVYGLDILAEKIEDRDDNMTRFFILRKGLNKESGRSAKTKSMISFKVDHQTPGALASVLKCFATFSLNLTSINSRPTKVVPFQYIFFLEFQGSRNNDPEGKVKKTLDALQKYVQDWRWLGSWDDELKYL
ncbi:hypothetical protein K3495_g1220 [Podosphaera aphanis]|nr:hypothetical protein K3495_g1220 [Podosphaera aphanis]